MFLFDRENELFCKATGNGSFFAKKGAMVGGSGDFKFEKVLIDTNGGNIVKGIINQAARRVTGENMEIMKVKGQGVVYLADEAQHVSVINLKPGESVSVESENLLAFTEDCDYKIQFVGTGVISQKGLFTSKIVGRSNQSQVVIKTDGNPLVLQTPCFVDPDAIVAWSGSQPSFKLALNWKNLIGQASGESYMLEFKDPGYIAIIQPSERLSGLKIGMDDNRYQDQSQQSSFGNTFGNNGGMFNGSNGQNGDNGGIGGIIGSVLGNRR